MLQPFEGFGVWEWPIARASWEAEGRLVSRFAVWAVRRLEGARVGEQDSQLLVERARAGDAEALEELFRSEEPVVTRLCRRMLGDRAVAEDARHEVFLRLRRGLPGYDSKQPFRSWLLAVASHHCIDQLRRSTTEARLFDAGDLDTLDLADPGPSPLGIALAAEQSSAVLQAIDALPPRYRAPLVLRYFNELDYDAIADALGVSRGQVGSLLFRAKRMLRERVSTEEGQ